MENFLKEIKNGNSRFYYLKFSENLSDFSFDNYTRAKSFIIYDVFEISCNHWNELYISIVNALQKYKPIEIRRLLFSGIRISGKCSLFNYPGSDGYIDTDFGLAVRNYATTRYIVQAIDALLTLYDIDKNDAYLIVDIPPKYQRLNREENINYKKELLKTFIERTYVEPTIYYPLIIESIDLLNKALKNFLFTSYNNLYLMNSLSDFENYSRDAIARAAHLDNSPFNEHELRFAVECLKTAIFYGGSIYREKKSEDNFCFIEEEDRNIFISFKTHYLFYVAEDNENE